MQTNPTKTPQFQMCDVNFCRRDLDLAKIAHTLSILTFTHAHAQAYASYAWNSMLIFDWMNEWMGNDWGAISRVTMMSNKF